MRARISILVTLVCCALCRAEPTTNILSIYLVDWKGTDSWPAREVTTPLVREAFYESVTRELPQKFENRYLRMPPLRQPANLDALKLVSPPVIADSDFLAYDTKRHTFTLSAAATTRLSISLWKLGLGEKPHVHHTGDYDLIPTPVLFVLKARGEAIYSGAFHTLSSSMGFSGPVILAEDTYIGTNVSKDVIFSFYIQLGYPGSLPNAADPRGDARVVSAVQTLFASKKH